MHSYSPSSQLTLKKRTRIRYLQNLEDFSPLVKRQEQDLKREEKEIFHMRQCEGIEDVIDRKRLKKMSVKSMLGGFQVKRRKGQVQPALTRPKSVKMESLMKTGDDCDSRK